MSAYVGTTHSFADRLLRLRPVEAWLSPSYEIAEDDEALVRETFEALFHAVENGTLALELEGAEAAARADEVRLPRPFCDALEAGLRAEFHETEWKICYGLDSLVEGFIRRRDVPPADVPPVPFDATAFRAVSDEFVALAAPVRRGSLGADWIAKTAAALRRLRGCDDPVQVSREIRRQLVAAPKKEATRKHTFTGDNKAWEVWKTYRDRLRDDLRAPSRTHRHGVKRR